MGGKDNANYTVYAPRSKTDNKVYIGATKQKLTKRFLNGVGYTNCKRFWDAIEEQGFSNFDHIVIAEGLTRGQAMKMEEALIDLLGTMNPAVGYNMRNGGEHNIPCNEVREKISRAQMGHRVSKELTERQKKLYGRPVIQLTTKGEFIAVYTSLKEAAREIRGHSTNIWSACSGRAITSYGFVWRFLDETNGEYDEEIISAGILKDERRCDAIERALRKAKKMDMKG